MQGYYSLLLHAHLPYVRHYEADRLEERWLYEAITETYIPLLWGISENDRVGKWTISISPPVMEMLTDTVVQRRYLQHIDSIEELLLKEKKRTNDTNTKKLVDFYQRRFQKIRSTFFEWEQDLIKAFRYYFEQGKIDCITTSATHAFLPYLQTEQGIRAQIVHGLTNFEKHFGRRPTGFWLPECAYTPGIDRILFQEGIRYTFVDEHTLKTGDPEPSKGIGAPVYSPHGIVLFPRNQQLSSKVWSSILGYPGDHDYREFYRDIAYERDWEYIKPFVHPDGIRVDTGLKFHRITGETEHKDSYVREWAEGKLRQHGDDFITTVHQQLDQHQDQCFPPHLLLTPFDAELFGHWWFEGPDWLAYVMTKGLESISFITPQEYIDRHYQDFETIHAAFSTWGRDGYGEVWLNDCNAWMYRHLHHIEKDIVLCISKLSQANSFQTRALKQMVREWMLAASSDWAFIVDNNSSTQYALNRFKEHINRYHELRSRLLSNTITKGYIENYEKRYPFLEDIDLTVFHSPHDDYVIRETRKPSNEQSLKILMLSWEFPPMVVGGLSRHVFDLSKALVQQGHEVYVITSHIQGYPEYEINQGVHVYRVKGAQPEANDFLHWIGSLNLAMADQGIELAKKIDFDCIHGHDWLVSVVSKGLKQQLNLPLIATIHATEHGRNNGIHTPIQYEINQKEWELTYEADKVIVCSQYMKQEVINVFALPEEKICIQPNGVDPDMIQSVEDPLWKQRYGSDEHFYIFSVGRIVKEKGFETIMEAAPHIHERHPHVKFLIAGKGPMLEEYRQLVKQRGLESTVCFIGYINDVERNILLNGCDVALFPSLYEPFGIVALEGMAAGKPVIVSDTGGLGDIVTHGENGLKIYPGNPQSLADQVIRLIEDPELRVNLARKGKEAVETRFSWGKIAYETSQLMEACRTKPELIGGK
jgi:1,4-alpha-glucan branching enzyme